MKEICNICEGTGKLGFQREDCCACFGTGYKIVKDNNSIYEDYREAAKYDKDLCTTIAMEECSELIQAISKAKRGKLDKDNMAEEIADVLISLEWIAEIYDISADEVDKWIDFKEKRIVNRLNNGEFK